MKVCSYASMLSMSVIFVAGVHAQAQQYWRSSNSSAQNDYEHRLDQMRERGAAIRQRLDDEYLAQQERRLREQREELERRLDDARANSPELRSGYRTYVSPYGTYPVPRVTPTPGYYRPSGYSSYFSDDSDDSDDEHRSAWALGVDDRRSPAGRDEQERASQQEEELRRQQEEEEGFAAASGKCGDVTTQKIGNFFYHSDGTVTQKVGDFFCGPDGQVTQKIGNFYYHSDGTTTQRVGNFYYDSDGGVTQKIGSFYYHSGGKPCEDDEEN